MIRTAPGQTLAIDRKQLEDELVAAARRWTDQLRDALIDAEGEAAGLGLYKRWSAALPPEYRERVPARQAVPDVRKIAALSADAPLGLALYRPAGGAADALGFKLYRLGAPIVLSDSLPMLEHMGVRVLGEQNNRIDSGTTAIALHDFELQAQIGDEFDFDVLARLFEDTFARVFRGEVESDDFNRLVLRAGLGADEIVVLRAYAKYLRQIGFTLSQGAIEATLSSHPLIARMLVGLFRLRFDPVAHDTQGEAAQVAAIEQALEKVSNLSEDRVLRQLLALIQATLRTNFWRTGIGHSDAPGPRRSFLSLKFDSARVPGLPEPKPLYEIFVYSPRFEGIHLRGGRVARGGLRWSDRPEDFRTEVLGPGEGADGEEHRHRAGRLEGRLRVEEGAAAVRPRRLPEGRHRLLPGLPARPARHHRQPGRHDRRAAAARRARRRRRPVSRRRRRQGHGDLLRLRECGEPGIRPLARRRLRLRRQRRLRPQGDGHHGARRVGKRQALLPRAGTGHPEQPVHGGRHRRHVGRRVRQRHAAVAAHPPAGGVRPSPRLPRPGSRRGRGLRRTRAPVQAAALVVGRLRHVADLRRRRRLGALREIDPAFARGACGARHRGRAARARRAAERAPESAGRPALQRRHRHLREGERGNARRGRRSRQRRPARQRPRSALQGRRRRRQPRSHAARPRRGGAERRVDQHRRDRQLGRRRHLGPRGQHQDPARSRRGRGRDQRGAAQRGAGADDGRRRGARPARQLLPDAGACRSPAGSA